MGKIEDIRAEADINKATVTAYFDRLLRLAVKLGYSSVYILVDRVDETGLTQDDANSSFEFIQSLLLDLHVLELGKVAFKFFLWDQIKSRYVGSGARTDRIPLHTLNWNLDEMSAMLAERLKAYSPGNVWSLNSFLDEGLNYDLHKLVCILAVGSPRDMILVSKFIADEQTRVKNEAGSLDRRVIAQGIKTFSEQRVSEMYGANVEDLLRVGLAGFTISKLASYIFRIKASAVSRKIQIWTDQGAVFRTGEVPTPGARPQNLYSLADPKLAIAVKPRIPVESVLERNLHVCRGCDSLTIFEEEDANVCANCQTIIDPRNSVFKVVAPTL